MSLSKAAIKVGDTHSAVVVDNLTRTQIVQYAGASGDYNPLHTDEIYATKVAGFPTVFAHGMLTMGLTARLVTDWVGDGRLLSLGSRFERQVWPGDTLTLGGSVVSTSHAMAEIELTATRQTGDVVVKGTASVRTT